MLSAAEITKSKALASDLKGSFAQTKHKLESFTQSVVVLVAYYSVFGPCYLSVEEVQSLPAFDEPLRSEIPVPLESSTNPFVALYMQAYRDFRASDEAVKELTATIEISRRFVEDAFRRHKSNSRAQSD